MSNVGIIIAREYTSRVKTRAFLLLTLLGPLFYALLGLAPILIAKIGNPTRQVTVVDPSHLLGDSLPSRKNIQWTFSQAPVDQLKKNLDSGEENGLLLVLPSTQDPFSTSSATLYSPKNVGFSVKESMEGAINDRLTSLRLKAKGVPKSLVDSLDLTLPLQTALVNEGKEQQGSSGGASAVALAGGFIVYIFIFLYGGLVMRGVQEEKQNRVVEVIVSSVKPFNLMLGKIVGIALVGLTQFVIWGGLSLLLTSIVTSLFAGGAGAGTSGAGGAAAGEAMKGALNGLGSLPIGAILSGFLIYFLGGYLLYSSMFSAIAAAADSQTDTYQFMFPLSVPILVAIFSLPAVSDNPDGQLAFWLSIIPFTSPVVMVARLPFEVPWWQVALSLGLLIITIYGTIIVAAKVYRTGILMYGKKLTIKEITKWIRYA